MFWVICFGLRAFFAQKVQKSKERDDFEGLKS